MDIIDNLQKISDTVWELPATYKQGMRVPARIIATEKLVREMEEAVYQQISNVATLPGISRYAPWKLPLNLNVSCSSRGFGPQYPSQRCTVICRLRS